jgi:hypothetical protein
MVSDIILYDESFFQRVLTNQVYQTQNILAVKKCTEAVEEPQWMRGEEVVGEEQTYLPIATNYTCMTFLLNRLNELLLYFTQKGKLFSEDEEGEELSLNQLDFMVNHPRNKDGFEREYKRFHALLFVFREMLFSPASKIFRELQVVLLNGEQQMKPEDNLFTKNIHQFFPRAIDVKATTQMMDVRGKKAAVNVRFNYRGLPLSAEVRPAGRIIQEGEYYKVWSDLDATHLSDKDFYVFILPNNYIYVFENDKTKIRNLSGANLLDRTADQGLSLLFHRDILVDYQKVF